MVAVAHPVSSDTRDAGILFSVDDHHGGRPFRTKILVMGVVLKACGVVTRCLWLPSESSFLETLSLS